MPSAYASEMPRTIEQVRLENYAHLRAEISSTAGDDKKLPSAAVARALGITPVYAWQLDTGARSNIDSGAARRMERAASKPEGWLDTDFRLWPFPGIAPERFDRLSDSQKLELQGAVRKMISDFETADLPEHLKATARDWATPAMNGIREAEQRRTTPVNVDSGKTVAHQRKRT